VTARDGFVGTIGRTPLIKLRNASEQTGCTILGKAEFLNPGGSAKDREALYIVPDAEERGLLQPGGVIVESTAGNTGIGLALVGNARGYRTVIVIPETQSRRRRTCCAYAGRSCARFRRSRTAIRTTTFTWPSGSRRNSRRRSRRASVVPRQRSAARVNMFFAPVNQPDQ